MLLESMVFEWKYSPSCPHIPTSPTESSCVLCQHSRGWGRGKGIETFDVLRAFPSISNDSMLKLGVRERDDGGRGNDKDIILGGRCRGKKRKGRDITINIPYHQIFWQTSLYHHNSYLGKITIPACSRLPNKQGGRLDKFLKKTKSEKIAKTKPVS